MPLLSSQGWVEGQRQVPGKAIRIFVQLSFGGTGMGLAVGFAVTILLRTMFDNHDAEVRFDEGSAWEPVVLPALFMPVRQHGCWLMHCKLPAAILHIDLVCVVVLSFICPRPAPSNRHGIHVQSRQSQNASSSTAHYCSPLSCGPALPASMTRHLPRRSR